MTCVKQVLWRTRPLMRKGKGTCSCRTGKCQNIEYAYLVGTFLRQTGCYLECPRLVILIAKVRYLNEATSSQHGLSFLRLKPSGLVAFSHQEDYQPADCSYIYFSCECARHLWPQAKLTNLSHAMMRMDRDKHASWQHNNPLNGVWPSRVEYPNAWTMDNVHISLLLLFFFFFF